MTTDDDSQASKRLPTLRTQRLILRPFAPADAPDVQRMAGAREIADTTMNIPHPYEDGVAEKWIGRHEELYEQGKGMPLAITLTDSGILVGAISLMSLDNHSRRAELGYWIGHEYWSKGYCTEAAARIIACGFEELELNRIFAHHLTRNPASGKVMQNIGMAHEGTFRQHVKRWGKFEDIECYGMLRSELGRAEQDD